MATCGGYTSGHTWYYKLGGRILTPCEIAREVELSDSPTGDANLVSKLEAMQEPKRSKAIKEAISATETSQAGNIERYNEVTRQLMYERERPGPYEWDKLRMWKDPTTATMLKHNHIAYAHATLCLLNAMVSVQMELF